MAETPLITNISNTKKAYIYKEIINKCYSIDGLKEIHIKCTQKKDIKIIKDRLKEMANILSYNVYDNSNFEKTSLNICNTNVYIELKKRKEAENHLKDIFKTNKQTTLILYREGLEQMPDIWQKAFNTMILEVESKYKQTMCS